MIIYNKSILRKELIASIIVLTLSGCSIGINSGNDGGGSVYASERAKKNVKEILNTSLYSAATNAENANEYKNAATHYVSLIGKLDSGAFGEKGSDDIKIGEGSNVLIGKYSVLKERFVIGAARNLRYAGEIDSALEVISIYERELKKAGEIRTNGEILSPAVLLEFSKSSISNKNLDAAVAKLKKLVDLGIRDWEIYSVLGIAYDYKNEFDKAMDAYKTALEISPDNPDVINNMGLSLALSGDIYGATEIFEELVKSVDGKPQYRQNLAILLALNGEMDRASELVYHDLPYDMATRNTKTYRQLMEAAY